MSRVTAVHQFVPTFEPGAVGGHALQVRRLLLDRGLGSEIYAEHLRMPGEVRGRRYTEYRGGPWRGRDGTVLLYHMAIGSTVADFVQARHEPLAVDHHNITPPSFFARWQPELVHGVAWGQDQLARLAGRAAFGVADSAFNCAELDAAGYRRTGVAPLLVDLSSLDSAADEAVLGRLLEEKAGAGMWLFVGRIAPNKCQHDVLKAFAAYRRMYDPEAKLYLVGGSASRTYWSALEGYAVALGLLDAVRLTGPVPAGTLAAHYRAADVFVCLSEHEGFCNTVVEAMATGTPVLAYASSAIPETVGHGALLLDDKDPLRVASAAHRVLTDDRVRTALVASGRERVGELDLDVARAKLGDALQRIAA